MLAALLLASAAHAAEVTASLLGTVRDASGAVVPGDTISLTNTQTNVTQKVQTGTDGEYSFILIPVGQYRLTVERTGFRKYVQEGIILQVNQAAKQDIKLDVGAQTEVVEVTGDIAQVDTVTATLGSVETQRRIVDLPLVERDTFQLRLLPAVSSPRIPTMAPEIGQRVCTPKVKPTTEALVDGQLELMAL